MNTARLPKAFRLLALTLGLGVLAPAAAQTAAPPPPAPSSSPMPGSPVPNTPVTTVEAALQRVFSAQTVEAAWFPSSFRAVLSQVQEAVTSFGAQYGGLQKVEKVGQDYRLTYAGGVITVTADIDGGGLLTTLLLKDARANPPAAQPPVAQPQPPKAAQAAPAAPPPTAEKPPVQADPAVLRAVTRLFDGTPFQADWFSLGFLAQVPPVQLRAVLAQVADGLGAFVQTGFGGGPATDYSATGYAAEFKEGRVPINAVSLDAQGRLSGLLLGAPQRSRHLGSFAEVVAALKALPGQTSLLVSKVTAQGASDVVALNPDAALAVGSAFKLAILAELQAQVTAGKLSWSTQATLQGADKSLPSGTLQNNPSGTKYSLQHLAEAMISVSDNTAADLLLRTVGRGGVEARLDSSGLGEAPMLGTRELFALKNPANAALLARYLAATGEARRAIIAEAASAPLPASGDLTLALGAEWHVSARHLCALMGEVAALPLMSLNPGVAVPADFARVSFKGGSDGGVLNLTTQVVTKKGETYCVSATWNNTQPVEEFRLIPLVQDVLALLK